MRELCSSLTLAQRTFIQEEFSSRLGLPALKSETCVMSGIGGHTEIFQTNIVTLKVSTGQGKELEFLMQTKPTITKGFSSITICPADQSFLQERAIFLSNSRLHGEHQIPQILVGLDHYYDFVLESENTLRTPSGLLLKPYLDKRRMAAMRLNLRTSQHRRPSTG